jgi:hypothetical protein
MGRLVLFSKLKDGVDPAAYEEWVRTVDYPLTRAQPHITGYEVTRLKGALFSDSPDTKWDYAEVIDFTSLDEYNAGLGTDEMKQVFDGFGSFIGEFECVHGESVG